MLSGCFDGVSSSGSKKRQVVHQVNDSLFELHKPVSTPSMEIVLFHGLNLGESSDAHLSTWEAEDGSIWPQKWLVEEYPAAHIFTVSYSGTVVKTSYEKFDMSIIVESLISDLRDANIGQTPYCPVVLVGHSFGGLVIKQLCLESRKLSLSWREAEWAKAESFLSNVRGIFYYGSPHHGSPLISPQAADHNSPLLKYFTVLSTEAERLNSEFDRLRRCYPKWRVGALRESLPRKSGLFQDVSEASLREGDIFNVFAADHILISNPSSEKDRKDGDFFNVFAADHMSISKPSSKNDRRFYSLIRLLNTIAKDLEDEGRKPEETALQRLPKPMVYIDAEVNLITSKLVTMRTLGLGGVGGVGKTTLAMAIFNKLGPNFQYTCFVKDVKLITGSVCEVKDAVWKHMYCSGERVGGETNFSVLNNKKLLLVLDDISYRDGEILHNLLKDSGSESRFIATSRDQDLLRGLDANEAEVYMVPFLNENSAKLLFMEVAFPSDAPPPIGMNSLFQAIVKKCDGLPLALNVLGSRLRQTRSYEDWGQTLNALTEAEWVNNLNERLWEKLRVNYDLLGPIEQEMFLDVCTFFGNNKNWTLYEAKLAWRVAYKTSSEGLLWKKLVDMSLVYDVKEDENIKIHEQLQSLGRKIASEPINLGKCRIWDRSMALKMLESEEMFHREEIYALRLVGLAKNDSKHDDLDGSEYSVFNHQIHIRGTALQKLKSAKFLEADVPISMSGLNKSQSMSSKLVLLKCYGVDLLKLALETSLVILQLSVAEDLPQSFGGLKVLQSLFLSECLMLEHLPDSFGHLASLSRLRFHNCPKLQTLPDSFGHLASLKHLELHNCQNLQTLSDSFGHLVTLNHLEFHNCHSLQTLPDSFGHLASLNHLLFHNCSSLQTLPDSFGHLASLKHLEFHNCHSLQTLPDSFGHLASLNHLLFHSCSSLQTLPDSFGHLASLKHLEFQWCDKLQTLPDSFGHLVTLNHLEFHNCYNLQTLPDSFGHLATLNHLKFHDCPELKTVPDSFGHLPTLDHLEFHDCHHLQTLPDSFGYLATLNHLEFHHCLRLQTLPDSFGYLATLNHLEFHHCLHLQTLPDSFGHLAFLNHLEFHHCWLLQTLPDSFRHLAITLSHLEFHNCDKLQTLPDSFGHLTTVNHVLQWDCGDTECEGDWKQKFRRFITKVIEEGANGYFVNKIWLSSLDEHLREAVVSILGRAGYFEIYQTCTTMFYERMEDYTQASSICNDPASTPENKNACDGDIRPAAASDDSGTLGQIEKAGLNVDKSAPRDQLDFDAKTLPFDNEKEYPNEVLEDSSSKEEDSDEKDKDANESTMVRINEVSLVDSPRGLLQGGETPLSSLNEELRSFKKTQMDSSMYNDDLSLSTHWLSTLNHPDLNATLSNAGYSETYNTKTTSYFERIQSHFPNSQTNQGEIFSRSEKSNVVGEAGSSIVFQGSADSLTDAVQGINIGDEVSGVKNATKAIPKIEAKCECPLQHLTVSMQRDAGPSTSPLQGECNFTVLEGELLEISTGVDKDISMKLFNFHETLGHSKVDVPLNVSAKLSLSCCITSDHKNVRIHILGIQGEAKVGGPFSQRTNALVLKSVRTNVDAWIKKSPARPNYIRLDIKEDNCPRPWCRVLHTCRPHDNNGQRKEPENMTWLDLTGKSLKKTRIGSKTLELQHHVKNKLKRDLDEDSHRALVLYFDGTPRVTFEGDILVDLDPNSFLELRVRHEVEISYNVPCDPHPTADAKSVFSTREPRVVEFDCVLEFRTQKLFSQNPVG